MSIIINEAKIGHREFGTLAEAWDVSREGDIVELLKDVTLTCDLNAKEGVKVLVPHGMKLCAGAYKADSASITAESALFNEESDCTWYGSLVQALDEANDGGEVIAYGEIVLNENTPLAIRYGITLTIPYRVELTVNGTLTVDGTLDIASNHSIVHTYGPINIGGTISVHSAAILWIHNEVNLTGGKLLLTGALCGDGAINANVKVFVQSTQQLNYYSRLYDALDELDADESSEVTALGDVSGFYTLTVPKGSKLIVPTGLRFGLDTDATLNVLGTLSVADVNALSGDTMVSLNIHEDAVLLGDGLSEQSNFYHKGQKTAAERGAWYRWVSICEETPYEEAWVKAED